MIFQKLLWSCSTACVVSSRIGRWTAKTVPNPFDESPLIFHAFFFSGPTSVVANRVHDPSVAIHSFSHSDNVSGTFRDCFAFLVLCCEDVDRDRSDCMDVEPSARDALAHELGGLLRRTCLLFALGRSGQRDSASRSSFGRYCRGKTVAMESLRVLHGSSSFGVDVCRDSDHWLDTDCASSGGGFLSIGRLSLLGSTKYRIGAAEPLSLQSFFCDEHSLWCGASGMVGWYFLWCCLPMAGAPQRASRRRHDGPCDRSDRPRART